MSNIQNHKQHSEKAVAANKVCYIVLQLKTGHGAALHCMDRSLWGNLIAHCLLCSLKAETEAAK